MCLNSETQDLFLNDIALCRVGEKLNRVVQKQNAHKSLNKLEKVLVVVVVSLNFIGITIVLAKILPERCERLIKSHRLSITQLVAAKGGSTSN